MQATSIKESSSGRQEISLQLDLFRIALLAIIVTLLWCTSYDRWTVASWETPLFYLTDWPNSGDAPKSDAMLRLAWIKAAHDGHISSIIFNTVPELGAPGTANWDDVPLTEKPLIVASGLVAHLTGVMAAANIAVLMGQVLAAMAFYAAGRMLGCSWIWAGAGALVFAQSSFSYAQALHHLEIGYYWHVPLCLVVCEWLMRGAGIKLHERRFKIALLVAAITGVQNFYYTYLFLQFVLIAGLLQWARQGWRQVLPAAAIMGTTVAAFLLMNLNTIFHRLAVGPSNGVIVRNYKWLEYYGLKLVDLVVPPPDHPFPPFAAWGARHLSEVFLSVGEGPPSAYLGLVGLAAMFLLVTVSFRRAANRMVLPLEAFLVLWIILFGTVGGINGIIGALGFQLIRTTTRYSIFILCLVLMYGVRRLSEVRFKSQGLIYLPAILVAAMAWWDQTPPRVSDHDVAIIADQVASDRSFTAKMEQALPAGAMIFQLPVMDFPEGAGHHVDAYEHLRPYLFAQNLRFSFGTDKGRSDWQQQVGQLAPAALVAELQRDGFVAIYINRHGFLNNAESLIKVFQDMGYTGIITSDRGDLSCLILKKP